MILTIEYFYEVYEDQSVELCVTTVHDHADDGTNVQHQQAAHVAPHNTHPVELF